MAVNAPIHPKRLRVMARMSQASTQVVPSGGCWAVPRHWTWVDMTVADSDDDDDDQDSGPESFVFDPVESDEEFDDVVNALERDLECDAGPRQIVNGEESFHSAQRGSELVGHPASSVGVDFSGPGSADDNRRVQIPTWAMSVSRVPATAEHAIITNREGQDQVGVGEHDEIQQSPVRQDGGRRTASIASTTQSP